MKIIKRIIQALLILILLGLIFRGWIFRHSFTYKEISQRISYIAIDKKLVSYIEESVDDEKDPEIEEIIKLGLSITSRHLKFTSSKNDNDPNKLINSKTAHCIGYAAFYSTTCNYLLKKFNRNNEWIAKPQKGQIYLFGTNIHKYFNTSFFESHDFVTIENNSTGEIFAVDPTVHDYFHIDFITLSK